jgi:hypothetical protein
MMSSEVAAYFAGAKGITRQADQQNGWQAATRVRPGPIPSCRGNAGLQPLRRERRQSGLPCCAEWAPSSRVRVGHRFDERLESRVPELALGAGAQLRGCIALVGISERRDHQLDGLGRAAARGPGLWMQTWDALRT